MSNKMKGILAGTGAFLGGCAIYIVLGVLGYIAWVGGALMGAGFVMAYRFFNKDSKSPLPIIIGAVLVLVGIAVSTLIYMSIWCAMNGVSLGTLFEYPEFVAALWIDVGVGLTIGYVAFAVILLVEKFKKKSNKSDENFYKQYENAGTTDSSASTDAAAYTSSFDSSAETSSAPAACSVCGAALDGGSFCGSCGTKN
ncbi:MAG: hypothetical protein FWH03_08480 [Firmicutes bacterium]|nr:hypothetical protein [Bacillota bacterium]